MKSPRFAFVIPAALMLFPFSLAPRAHATELARVNGKIITLEEFNKLYQENSKYFQLKAPTKKEFLNGLMNQELGVQQAKKLHLDKDPEVVMQMNSVLYNALLDKELGATVQKIRVSDDEAKEYYEKNPEIKTSHIFVAAPSGVSQADQQKAYQKIKKIYEEQVLPGKESFAEIAQNYSEGPTAAAGGDLGYQTQERLDPNYYAAAVKLRINGVSGIVHSIYGYHIIKLTGIRSWNDVDHTQVKRALFEQKKAQLFTQYMNQLKQRAHYVVHPELLKN